MFYFWLFYAIWLIMWNLITYFIVPFSYSKVKKISFSESFDVIFEYKKEDFPKRCMLANIYLAVLYLGIMLAVQAVLTNTLLPVILLLGCAVAFAGILSCDNNFTTKR